MPMRRIERERVHELRKEHEKHHEEGHKHHSSRGGF